MYTSSFTTVEIGTKPSYVRPGRQSREARKQRVPAATWVKLGICATACVMMLAMRELDTPVLASMATSISSSVSGNASDETDLTEMLGKLQFVEFPGALEVFSSATRMVFPVSAPAIFLEDDAEYAQWAGAPNAEVVASAAGEVRDIGEDPVLGQYVRIAHEGELETVYYGFETVSVESGQPVRRQDTLGNLTQEGVLRMSVLLSGRPQPPANYLKSVNVE